MSTLERDRGASSRPGLGTGSTGSPAAPRTVDALARRSWDPLLRPVAWLVLVAGLVLNADAIGGKSGFVVPNTIPLLVGLAMIGMAVILPRPEPAMMPGIATMVVALAVVSVVWSHNNEATVLWLRSYGLVSVGIVALVAVLPNADIRRALLWFGRVVLVITLVAVATDPLARIHIDPTGESPPLEGWHGWFVHKNVMAAFLILNLATVLAFDRRWWTKWPSLAAIVFLFSVSDSTTGRSAAITIVAVFLWLKVKQRLTGRSSITFVMATTALLAVVGLVIWNSLAAIADAAGKDLTFTGRTKIWSAAWHAILREPVLGYGINGLFRQPMTPETAEVLRAVGFKAGHPHNGLIDVTVQLGFVGAVLVILLIVGNFRSSFRLQYSSPAVAAWGLSLMTALCVMSFGESVFLNSSIAVLFTIAAVTQRERRARLSE